MLPNVKLYYKNQSNQTAWCCHKNIDIDQWYRIESPEINPHIYSQLIFYRGGKNIQWAKYSLFNKCCWENWKGRCREMKLDHLLTPHTRINSKWIEDLNVRPETIKILEEIIGSKISNIAHSSIFLIYLPRHRKQNKTQKGLHQTKKVLHSKGNHQQNEEATYWIFADTSEKGLISKIYKELIKLNSKKKYLYVF